MESTTTRISDLPNAMNGRQQMSSQQMNTQLSKMSNTSELSNNYVPINIHPNPYGVSDKNPIINHPEQSINHQF